MDKPRHPQVIRTWVTPRNRRPEPNYPGRRVEDPYRGVAYDARQRAGNAPRKEKHL
jgi:hypothetical protein